MGLDDEFLEIVRANDTRMSSSGAHRPRQRVLPAPLAAVQIAKQRAGLDAYVEARRESDEAGVSTMARVNGERFMAVIEGLERATHRVLGGACDGELVRQFLVERTGKIKVEIVAGPRRGKIMILDSRDLEEINKMPFNE